MGQVHVAKTLFSSDGNFMGGSISQAIQRLIWIHPDRYNKLTLSEKYEVARIVGKLNKMLPDVKKCPTMLIGPGRWGTSTPSLGVPVKFSEIDKMAALVEVAVSREGFMPELSFGTHFFHDMVETGIFFIALFPDNKNCFFDKCRLESFPNELDILLPNYYKYRWVIQVSDVAEMHFQLRLYPLHQLQPRLETPLNWHS